MTGTSTRAEIERAAMEEWEAEFSGTPRPEDFSRFTEYLKATYIANMTEFREKQEAEIFDYIHRVTHPGYQLWLKEQ